MNSRDIIDAIVNTCGDLPAWLNRPRFYTSELAWLYTWYMCIDRIARSPKGNYYLLLIDDCGLIVNYCELCEHVGRLVHVSTQTILAVQLTVPPINHCRELVEGADVFQHSFAGTCDLGLLLSPTGAVFMRDYANSHSSALDSCQLTNILTAEKDQPGLFSLSPAKWHDSLGFVYFCRDPRMSHRSDRKESMRLKEGNTKCEC